MPPTTEGSPTKASETSPITIAANEAIPTLGDRLPAGGPSGTSPREPPPAGPTAARISEVLDGALETKSELFRGRRDVLRETYVPSHLPHREHEIHQVAEILAPALRGDMPSNVLIYGKIGTGKTAVVAQVRLEMERRADRSEKVRFVSVNCANIDTAYSLLQTIGNAFASTEIDRIPTGWAMDRVQNAMRRLIDAHGGTIIVVLDEIDRLVEKSGDGVLYTLSEINRELPSARVVLVGISNDLKFTNGLDARVRSRLNDEKILFPPYTAPQLQDILSERVQEAFKDGIVESGVVERCAAYAFLENGDARRALALLRLSAEMAERDRSKRITQDHVVKAKNRYEQDIIIDCCRTLPPHCKVLLYAILQAVERNRHEGVLTGDVYSGYSKLCQRLGLQPLHTRSISNHLSELETLGLIRATIVSRGRGGRTREIVADIPVAGALPVLEEDSVLAPIARPRGRGQTVLMNFDNPNRPTASL